MQDPNINRILAKRYQLQELIGSGAMGQVYRAKDILLGGVPVAVKLLSLSIQNKKIRIQERFEQEAKTCALLGQKSIHIVRVMDYGVDENGTPFYVMEYLKGKDLGSIIRSKTLTLARFLSLARHISLGLLCAHQGILINGKNCTIIHRDIKPNNVLVIQDPSFGELAKLLDFGIAKLLQGDSNQTKYYMGTLAYSSPEQMEGSELDRRSDIYSLGVMMFEMIVGNIPIQPNTDSFGGWYKAHHFQPPRSFNAVSPKFPVPPALQDLVMSCLAKAQDDRPQSVSDIIGVLTSLEQQASTAPTLLPVADRSDSKGSQEIAIASVKDSSANQPLSMQAICPLIAWPISKPIADIVFPHPIHVNDETMAALWVMLPQSEIIQRLRNRTYNQFLFIPYPHPMLLWITALYHRAHGAKWIPYYLDLKNSQNLELLQLMAKTGFYRVLLFARESPHQASSSLFINIAPAQRQLLQEWAMLSQTVYSATDPNLSKTLLKQEYEKLKPSILSKLEVSL